MASRILSNTTECLSLSILDEIMTIFSQQLSESTQFRVGYGKIYVEKTETETDGPGAKRWREIRVEPALNCMK